MQFKQNKKLSLFLLLLFITTIQIKTFIQILAIDSALLL